MVLTILLRIRNLSGPYKGACNYSNNTACVAMMDKFPLIADGLPSGVLGAVNWIESLLLGPAAYLISTLAIAAIGYALLDGRLAWKRAVTAIVGCFLIFGAPIIASGLMPSENSSMPYAERLGAEDMVAPPPPRPAEHYDPYAGPALPERW
ncbi:MULTISPECIES: TrbC/VirB2 family protein [Sphingobium]|nr:MULTISPECIES: TrbC/VirB2 family protein [Sphingobium]